MLAQLNDEDWMHSKCKISGYQQSFRSAANHDNGTCCACVCVYAVCVRVHVCIINPLAVAPTLIQSVPTRTQAMACCFNRRLTSVHPPEIPRSVRVVAVDTFALLA